MFEQSSLSILIADDHPLFRNALRQALASQFPKAQWFEADSGDALRAKLEQGDTVFDLVLLDLQMPGSHGYSSLVHLRSHHADIPVVVVSAHEDATTVRRALQYGSMGFIPKSADMDTLAQALQTVLDGEIWLPSGMNLEPLQADDVDMVADRLSELTPQQHKVLHMFAEGLLNKQIAYDLGVSEATIKAHATAIFRKLGVRNRTQAVIELQRLEMEKTAL
ncbi:response regulator transcription factor [Paraferrimonas haliotis]|uniref:DNA-binding response regulator n=1 Tax=Paraferrimonas haliotis TaxID=2013866 RepID=A0AA37TWP8_9GAMM|nr:response regulator transcription factor [Paraferrimonas haliotis]GLS84444.1 DNA-binding response regulator [Paraferrimonas haliotis]